MTESISSRTNPMPYSVAHEPPVPHDADGADGAEDAHHPTLDEHVRSILDTPEGVSATRRPRAMGEFQPIPGVLVEQGVERFLAHRLEISAPVAAGLLECLGPALGTIYTLGEGAIHDIERGQRENQIYHHDRYRGFIAGFEGRSASPEARREAALHPGYRDGLAAFERFLAHAPPAEVTHLRAHVDASRTAGMDAVLLGRDHGAGFERRYESDLVFHHAVDFERREHSRNPEAFATKKAAAEAREIALSRHSLPVRP